MPAFSDIDAAFEAWLDSTEEVSVSPEDSACALRYRRFRHTVAAIENESDYLVLCRIETQPEYRGAGSAGALLSHLAGLCDRFNVTLLAPAMAYEDTGLAQDQLLAWYARHGFEIDRSRTAQPLVWYPARPVR